MIAARELRKTYGSSIVIDGVSFELEAGRCLVLLGPNGAGKTTLLRMLATLLRPTAGALRIGGADALREPERARALIGMVAHGSYLYEDLTARENLRFWETMRGGDPESGRLAAALAQVELDQVADERVRTFSAGMKRRLALARVLLGQARLLLLDEPFTGLDQRAKKWLEEHLASFKAAGGAIVMTTHSFGRELAVADRIAILAGGAIALDTPRGALSADDVHRLYALHAEDAS
jgi:heme ABC exporter ATP-binding subunit CcmA